MQTVPNVARDIKTNLHMIHLYFCFNLQTVQKFRFNKPFSGFEESSFDSFIPRSPPALSVKVNKYSHSLSSNYILLHYTLFQHTFIPPRSHYARLTHSIVLLLFIHPFKKNRLRYSRIDFLARQSILAQGLALGTCGTASPPPWYRPRVDSLDG